MSEQVGASGGGAAVGSSGTPTRRVAVVGSSGGNLYRHGGEDPAALLREVRRQLNAADVGVADVAFVAVAGSLDGGSNERRAALWTLDEDGDPTVVAEGDLAEVNQAATTADGRIAREIQAGRIDALVLVSADPDGVNRASVEAAAAAGIPGAGSGGTSVSAARARGVELVAASGTTGTSNRTRAVSYAAGLARRWGLRYRPVVGETSGPGDGQSPWRRISVRGIMMASLPAFIAMAISLALSRAPGFAFMGDVFDTLIAVLPVVVAVMAARRVSGLDEVGVIAGVVAGALSVDGGILGGLLGGIGAGVGAHYLLAFTLARRFPATTANIVAGGVAGLAAGLVIFFVVAPITTFLGEGVRDLIEAAVGFNGVLAGALAGLLIWPAIIAGVYHAAILPLVLLEMEQAGNSFFGAIDMVGLVVVSAGITVANVIRPRAEGERAMAASGAAVNLGFGTFVEASYPFMFSDRRVFATAIASATAGGAVVGAFGARSTAYVPTFVAPAVSNTAIGMVLAMLTSFGLAVGLTLVINLLVRRRPVEG